MLGAYESIMRCESAIAEGTDAWRSIAALMLPCYRNQLKVLAEELSADEQREFEGMVLRLHAGSDGTREDRPDSDTQRAHRRPPASAADSASECPRSRQSNAANQATSMAQQDHDHDPGHAKWR